MTTTAWAHVPNAAHIDRVLASVKKNPEKWATAGDTAGDTAHTAAWNAARYEARYAAWDTARGKAWDAAWGAAWDAARGAVWDAVQDAAWNTAWDAILALLAWDDCAYMLELPEDALKLLREAGNEQAILLSVAANILKETL